MVRLRLWLGLGFRSRFGFLASCWFLFLASRRLRFLSWSRFSLFCRCWFGFLLLLSRLRFRLLLSGRFRFRCWRCRPRLRFLLLLRDPLVLWKVPVLHIRRHNLGALRILVDLHHTERAQASSASHHPTTACSLPLQTTSLSSEQRPEYQTASAHHPYPSHQ